MSLGQPPLAREAAGKAAWLSQKTRRERREANGEAVAVIVAPERQPEKASTKAAPDQNNLNGKRLSLTDLRIAARQRLAMQRVGAHNSRS